MSKLFGWNLRKQVLIVVLLVKFYQSPVVIYWKITSSKSYIWKKKQWGVDDIFSMKMIEYVILLCLDGGVLRKYATNTDTYSSDSPRISDFVIFSYSII